MTTDIKDPGLERPAWIDARLAYAYLQLEKIAESLLIDSPEEGCVRSAMSKLDEADMEIRRRANW